MANAVVVVVSGTTMGSVETGGVSEGTVVSEVAGVSGVTGVIGADFDLDRLRFFTEEMDGIVWSGRTGG